MSTAAGVAQKPIISVVLAFHKGAVNTATSTLLSTPWSWIRVHTLVEMKNWRRRPDPSSLHWAAGLILTASPTEYLLVYNNICVCTKYHIRSGVAKWKSFFKFWGWATRFVFRLWECATFFMLRRRAATNSGSGSALGSQSSSYATESKAMDRVLYLQTFFDIIRRVN